MRTLVVSDLHLGARTGRDLLRGREVRAPLLDALAECDRLVLLGDLLELRQGPVRDALGASEPVFRDLAAALGSGRQIIIVPGNHDHHLLGPWLERRSRQAPPPPLGLQTAVDWRAGETLATVVRWLAPVEVEVAYPGVWLRPDAYAMHGHYADRHTTVPMLERLGAGAMARIVREPADGPRRAEDYEATLAPIYAWIHAVAQAAAPQVGAGGAPDPHPSADGAPAPHVGAGGAPAPHPGAGGAPAPHPGAGAAPAPHVGVEGASARAWGALSGHGHGRGRGRAVRRRALVAAFPILVAALNRAGLGPLRPDLSRAELRRAGLRAVSDVLSRLGVDATHVIFGHSHRAGPLPGDDPSEWGSSTGARLLNVGCWVHEPGFLGAAPHTSPYRAGFTAVLDGDAAPELVNLLDSGQFPGGELP